MANLQVKNVPDALYRKVRGIARKQGRTMRELILDAVRREVGRADWHARLEQRARVELERPAADIVEDERAARERELGA